MWNDFTEVRIWMDAGAVCRVTCEGAAHTVVFVCGAA